MCPSAARRGVLRSERTRVLPPATAGRVAGRRTDRKVGGLPVLVFDALGSTKHIKRAACTGSRPSPIGGRRRILGQLEATRLSLSVLLFGHVLLAAAGAEGNAARLRATVRGGGRDEATPTTTCA